MEITRRGDGKGYGLVRADPEDHGGLGRRYVTVDRLAAVAWGVLDGLGDDREVHHVDYAPVHTAETNLEALPPEKHGQVTRADVQARQERVRA